MGEVIPWYIRGRKGHITYIYTILFAIQLNTYIRNNYLERQNGGNFDFYDDITFEFEGTE